MRRLRWLCVVLASCGSGAGGSGVGAARIAPEHLTVRALPGGSGVLELTGLSMGQAPQRAEVYAALKNVGATPACDAAFAIELFDRSEQSVAAGISGVLAPRFYRRTNGTQAIVGCVGPGAVGMAAIMDLPVDLRVEDVGFIVYHCPHFALEVEPVEGLSVHELQTVRRDAGTAFAGHLVNGFDVTVSRPAVSVFPVDPGGRPLGMAESRSDVDEVPTGESWQFETSAVEENASGFVAFPQGVLQAP